MYSVTTDHKDIADDICLVESWIKTSENDKSNDYGMNLPIGTWIAAMKVENEEVWQRVKQGELKGFSIESFVNLDEINLKKQNTNMTEEVKMETIELNEGFWTKLSSIISDALGISKKTEEVEMEKADEVVEETVELAEEVPTEEVIEEPTVVEEVVNEVIDVIEETAPTEEDKIKELEEVINGLKEEINKKDEMIAEMSKNIEKLSKQPSVEPINVKASKQSEHPSFLDFASGRVKY